MELGELYRITCDGRFFYKLAISPRGRVTVIVDQDQK